MKKRSRISTLGTGAFTILGLVYIACYMDEKVRVEQYQFRGNRAKIREQSVVKALDLLRRTILDSDRGK